MTSKNKNNNNKGTFSTIASKFNNWYTILIVIAFIGSGIGNYMVTTYRLDQIDEEYDKLEARVKVTEEINYELLIQQLEDIQEMNNKLGEKINETNGRIDKVLEILIDK